MASGSDPIGKTEVERLACFAQLLAFLQSADGTAMGYPPADITAYAALVNNLTAVVGEVVNKQTELDVAIAAKHTAMEAAISETRRFFRVMRADKNMDDARLAAAGLRGRDAEPTSMAAAPTRPVLVPNRAEPYRLTLAFFDESTPTSRAKPRGIDFCEIEFIIQEARPVDGAGWRRLALDTATPYLAVFDEAEAGKLVWLRARWLTHAMAAGPWSDLASARVPG